MGNNVLPARGGELLRTFLLGSRVADDEAHDPRHDPRRARARRGRARRDPRRARGAACCADCRSRTRRSCWSASALRRRCSRSSRRSRSCATASGWSSCCARSRRWRRRRKQLLSRFGLVLLVVSLLIWGVEASVYMAVGHAVDITLSLQDALAVVAFTNAASLIPAAPGYIGTYDAAVIFAVGAVSTRLEVDGPLLPAAVALRPLHPHHGRRPRRCSWSATAASRASAPRARDAQRRDRAAADRLTRWPPRRAELGSSHTGSRRCARA